MIEFDKPEIIERGGLRFKRVIHVDNDMDPATEMGKYSNSFEEYCVDRKTGILYGKHIPDLEYNDTPCIACKKYWGEDREAPNACINRYDNDLCENCAEALADDEKEEFWYEILIRDLPTDHEAGDRHYRYWIPGNYGDSLDEEEAKYAADDYKRIEAYNNNEWCYTYIHVGILDQNNKELDYNTLGGVESDCDACEFDSITDDMISDLKDTLPGVIQREQEALGQLALALQGAEG